MQILVLGMHRSGTSMVARLLNMMGAYFPRKGLKCQLHLRSANCEWYRISSFTVDKIPNEAMCILQR